MTQKRILAKTITIKCEDKLFAGVTDVSFDSSVKTETSLVKEDNGHEKKEVVGREESFSISGVLCVNDKGAPTTTDWAPLRKAAREGKRCPFVYGLETGMPQLKGNLQIISWGEKAGVNGYATYSLKAEVIQDETLQDGIAK
ncbi:hypothetical protein K4L44_05835 [Halosquirtibacter laminarini]|uniref:Uncharacterized protein n=1 Tax=Halosquirtibacter laminarini TaxID=3374600 RepID=A0AC61NI43_9BACT|nr:hypothetical protein K4L44_05835 [Prolixibacteraceae bacterium]